MERTLKRQFLDMFGYFCEITATYDNNVYDNYASPKFDFSSKDPDNDSYGTLYPNGDIVVSGQQTAEVMDKAITEGGKQNIFKVILD